MPPVISGTSGSHNACQLVSITAHNERGREPAHWGDHQVSNA